ncbi:hypothetical protein A2U01_0056798, partial [Trifolium medium]|nr:hypothetical protein [Trifolium medium]
MSGRYNISYADPPRRGEDVVPGFFRFWLSGLSCGARSELISPLPLFGGCT